MRGTLTTKDAGYFDDDGLHITGRVDDGFISGGENVHPREIEACLSAHPAILEVAVVPIHDATWGARPVAVFASAAPPHAESLVAWCRAQLSPAKVPAHFLPIAALPRTALGKPARAEIAQWVARTLASTLPSARSELS